MKTIFLTAATVLATTPVRGEILTLTEGRDFDLLSTALREQMLEPESMELSDVFSAPDLTSDTSITYICGEVRSHDRTRGYSNAAPFLVMIANEPMSGARSVQVARIGSTPFDRQVTLDLCETHFQRTRDLGQAKPSLVEAIKGHSSAEFLCSMQLDVPASCDRQETFESQLISGGWCISGFDSVGWVKCTAEN
ncbi:hypothetical protein JYP51_09610 [Ponticoccus gilvus]|nr:hypothetical protein [Enemella evansiae]